jgi:hypothetical protein
MGIDSNVRKNRIWNDSLILSKFEDRKILVNDSIFDFCYRYTAWDSLRYEALDLLLEKRGVNKLLNIYKILEKQKVFSEYSIKERNENIQKINDSISPYIKSFGRIFLYYLYIHGIESCRSCEEGNIKLGEVYK